MPIHIKAVGENKEGVYQAFLMDPIQRPRKYGRLGKPKKSLNLNYKDWRDTVNKLAKNYPNLYINRSGETVIES